MRDRGEIVSQIGLTDLAIKYRLGQLQFEFQAINHVFSVSESYAICHVTTLHSPKNIWPCVGIITTVRV